MWTASSHHELETVHPGEKTGGEAWWAQCRGPANQQGTTQLFSNSRGIQKSKHCIFQLQEKTAAWKTCTGNSAVIQTAQYVLDLVAAWPFGGQHQGLFLTQVKIFVPMLKSYAPRLHWAPWSSREWEWLSSLTPGPWRVLDCAPPSTACVWVAMRRGETSTGAETQGAIESE